MRLPRTQDLLATVHESATDHVRRRPPPPYARRARTIVWTSPGGLVWVFVCVWILIQLAMHGIGAGFRPADHRGLWLDVPPAALDEERVARLIEGRPIVDPTHGTILDPQRDPLRVAVLDPRGDVALRHDPIPDEEATLVVLVAPPAASLHQVAGAIDRIRRSELGSVAPDARVWLASQRTASDPQALATTTEGTIRVMVEKSRRLLHVFSGDRLVKSYDVALGPDPEGHKREQGDGRTPEGHYVIDYRNPDSKYHLSLHVSYPDEGDRQNAAERGVPPGGDIFIHGLPPAFAWVGAMHRAFDWTEGCIAVTNDEIEELWEMVPDGSAIEIRP